MLAEPFFLLLEENSAWNRVRSLLSMGRMLLDYNFEPRPNSRALGDSIMNIGLSIKGCSHSKASLTRENRIGLVWKFGLRLLQKRLRGRLILQRLDAIHAKPPFLVLGQEEDTAMLCLQGDFTLQAGKIQC